MLFQFTPVLRRATSFPGLDSRRSRFNSRPSCDGRRGLGRRWRRRRVSIHARLATGDPTPLLKGCSTDHVSIHARLATGDVTVPRRYIVGKFQFTPVLRRATTANRKGFTPWQFQFTPVLRRATEKANQDLARQRVSIHARLATGDTIDGVSLVKARVSIHARLATGDIKIIGSRSSIIGFQFTPVLRRATQNIGHDAHISGFNSRPSCDGRLHARKTGDKSPLVSIHARLATGDAAAKAPAHKARFQFTPVLRRATKQRPTKKGAK